MNVFDFHMVAGINYTISCKQISFFIGYVSLFFCPYCRIYRNFFFQSSIFWLIILHAWYFFFFIIVYNYGILLFVEIFMILVINLYYCIFIRNVQDWKIKKNILSERNSQSSFKAVSLRPFLNLQDLCVVFFYYWNFLCNTCFSFFGTSLFHFSLIDGIL